MQMPPDDREPHLTAGLDSPEGRSRIATAGVIIACDPVQQTRAVLYGRETLEEIAQNVPVLSIDLDTASEELDRLVMLIVEIKGRSSFCPADLFPKFKIDAASFDSDPDLLAPVRHALDAIRTHHRTLLPPVQLRFYYAVNAAGFTTANEELRQGAQMAQMPVAYIHSVETLGRLLYQRLPADLIKPTRCLDLVHGLGPLERDIGVRCCSLRTRPTPRGSAYHSRRGPRMRFGGDPQERLVAFSEHSLERICERTVCNWRDFGGHGDAFAFLDNCVYFEDCTAARGEPSFAVYNSCVPHFHSWGYVEHVLGIKGIPTHDAYGDISRAINNHRFYYRVGYCPVAFHGDTAVATTLLFPGMNRQKGTPEGRLIESCGRPAAEVARMKAQVETQLSMEALADSGDFSLIKWFHENGVPQVVTIDREVFKYD